MPNPTKLKQTFLKKLLLGLQPITSLNTNLNFSQRKKAIQTSSDLAIATTRNGTTLWSRAIIAKSSNRHARQAPREVMISSRRRSIRMKMSTRLRKTSRKVAKRHSPTSRSLARSVAKSLVRKRIKVLRSLVPGGEFMEDEVLLIEEALDYISFLRVQVDGMQFLANCL